MFLLNIEKLNLLKSRLIFFDLPGLMPASLVPIA